ncbi:putative house-cleaning noncanonical NTP pyrophosphatase (MazG superfamily) [Desulfitispora alkaliphila]|uniref:phosphoribosyl-ATP pyrophosphohydrolase n=1 Tax=Desulfitispora alkaliphila TaxID=622674 RepID=UPI003D22D128
MTTAIHNKLVRDKIPNIIINANKKPLTRIASDQEYKKLLQEKLIEEVNEFIDSDSVEELADILEVLKAISETKGLTWEEVEKIADDKRNERGGFKEKIILAEVQEK